MLSCKKETVTTTYPVMKYQDLQNIKVSLNQSSVSIDVDNNGTTDLLFAVGVTFDPITQVTEKQAQLICVVGTFIPIKSNTQSPILNFGDRISTDAFPGYQWNNAWLSVLARKNLTLNNSSWTGDWKDASHKYIPFTVEKGASIVYFGWLELSFDATTETITLHKCAISTENNKAVKAGN